MKLLPLFCLLIVMGMARQGTVTPPPATEPVSIFPNDPCATPCWFNIIPGETTTKEIEAILLNNENLVGWHRESNHQTQTTPVENGYYYLQWNETDIERIIGHVHVANGIVHSIVAESRETLHLNQVLQTFGTPDVIRLAQIPYSYLLILIYIDTHLSVHLHSGVQQDCTIQNIQSDFSVRRVVYYSPQAARERLDYLNDQQALTATSDLFRQIPFTTWEDWLEGNVQESCGEAWWSLPPEVTPIPLPPLPTATATRNQP
jgi:hypothetical protein